MNYLIEILKFKNLKCCCCCYKNMDPQKAPFSYYNEISLMMYGFGDSHKPNPETVRLVESIVLKQLRAIVNEALKYWDGKALKGEDVVFLLRHNKTKMQRFVRFLQNKMLKNKLKNVNAVIEIDPEEKPRHKLIDFIEKIDETGEFLDLSEIDEIKAERQIRADRISQALDEKKYLDFHKARCASFKVVGAGLEHLRLWIDPKRDVNFKPEALDVLSYMAYQTVAEITDYALLVREDMRSGTDPLKHLPGSYYTSAMFKGQHRFEGSNPDYSRASESGSSAIVVLRAHTNAVGVLSEVYTGLKYEGRRKYLRGQQIPPSRYTEEKRSNKVDSSRPVQLDLIGMHTYWAPQFSLLGTAVYSSQPPISVNEIKEVMRRVHSPQAGKLNFGGKVPETHYIFAL